MSRPLTLTRRLTQLTLAAAILAGCVSPEPRYYTLAQRPAAGDMGAGFMTPAAGQATEPVWIAVAPVRVPERFNRANLLLDQRDGTLEALELARWSAPLPDELRDALSQRLQADLGAVDTYQQSLPVVAPLYRITVELVQMHAELGARTGATLNWTVQRWPDGKVVAGHTQAELPASNGVAGVVLAYQQIVAQTAVDIAATVRTLQP